MKALENELEILHRVARSEQEAFRSLVVYYRPLLVAYSIIFTKSRERAEELVQDAFIQVWSVRDTLPGMKNFKGFLYIICRNMAFNAVRNQVREKARQKKWLEDQQQEMVMEPQQNDDLEGLVDQAVAQLPPQQQRVWVATRREGKRLAEVAKEMDLNLTSIKKYVQLANRSIAAYILKRTNLVLLISFLFKK